MKNLNLHLNDELSPPIGGPAQKGEFMSFKSSNKKLATLLLLSAVLLMTASSGIADTKDTADDVMRAGKQASADAARLLGDLKQRSSSADSKTKLDIEIQIKALTKLQPLFSRIGSDRAYATQILNFSLKSDKQGLGAFWQKGVLGSSFQIREIKDWYVYAIIEVDGYLYEMCMSSNNTCGGKGIFTMLGKAK